ncbi:hypothetical protein B0H13DRAFT_2483298 [Mycena leptocephala]|nr:hypothetical protein B0H13DRAFT_2483298 [Mycena leptocephala]
MSTIHPALRLQNTSRLSVPIRRLALTAVNGSFEDVQMLYTFVCGSDTRLKEAELCVPIFYALIDPSSIPDGDTFEHIIMTSAHTTFITCAIGTAMVKSSLIRDASPDLWLRVWPWIHFIDTYWDYLPGELPATTFTSMSVLLLGLRTHPEVASVVSATPGVRSVLAHAWVMFLSGDSLPPIKELVDVLSELTQGVKIPANFEEIVSAVGGCYDQLASVVIKHISLGLTVPNTGMRMVLLSVALIFLDLTAAYDEFSTALVAGGVISALISVLVDFTGTTTHLTETAIYQGMKTLIGYFPGEPMYPRVAEALGAGLLRFIIGCAVKYGRTTPIESVDVSPSLGWVMRILRYHTLVSWTVITAMRDAFTDAQKSPQYREFTKLPLFQRWTEMAEDFEHRLQALEEWETTGCHWVACSKTTRKFKRCAGCESAYFCSAEFQCVDWRAAHRDVCQSLKYDPHCSLYRRFTRRDRAFMRVLIDHDYTTLKYQIFRDVVLFMHSHPDDQDGFFVHLDHTCGVLATVLPRCDFPEFFAGYRDTRMRPVLISFGTFNDVTRPHYVFPLGASSTVLDTGLHRIAREIPAGAEASEYTPLVEQRVLELMQAAE